MTDRWVLTVLPARNYDTDEITATYLNISSSLPKVLRDVRESVKISFIINNNYKIIIVIILIIKYFFCGAIKYTRFFNVSAFSRVKSPFCWKLQSRNVTQCASGNAQNRLVFSGANNGEQSVGANFRGVCESRPSPVSY